MKPRGNWIQKQSGMALITTLLLLLLMAAIVVGFMLMVTEGQRLTGLDNDQQRAFYSAEAGMEKMTADLGTLFSANYAPTGAEINALTATPPPLGASSGVSFVDSQGNSTYTINFPKDPRGNPLAQFAQIKSGASAFQGMSALETTYTLTVGALTGNGSQVKLQRTTQTVGIPLFQFGIFSETDLSFFPGPNFNFGGRVHTNGNLFLDSGGPAGAGPTNTAANQLWMASPVTASKDILRDCLSNTHPESANGTHPGSVEITKGGGVFQQLDFKQGSLNSCLGSGKNSKWPAISASFNGNLRSGVKPLKLTITLLGAASPVDMIRRPVQGENSGVLGERYFSQASLRILLSDNAADITNLPCVSAGQPFNLAHLAQPVATWSAFPDSTALLAAMTGAGTIAVPLAASGAAGAKVTDPYSPAPADGYWQPNGTPIITGYIKIDAQTSYGVPCGTYKDVTQEILSLGYAGRNVNPVALAPPQLPGLPGAQQLPSNCPDPHPNAVIRLERVRDNPSNYAGPAGACGVSAAIVPPLPSDYWPNALFDTREGARRDVDPGTGRITLGGLMNYVELDVKNLARWFSGTLPAAGSTGPSTLDPNTAPNNFVVYISDRRGNYAPAGAVANPWPPLSPSGNETGEYGYSDFINPATSVGCPNGTLDAGEDLDQTGALYTYGETSFPNGSVNSSGVPTASILFLTSLNATAPDPNCATGTAGTNPWPGTYLINANEGRENPLPLFRRGVKIVNGNLISLPACPGGVSCGLSIATENPAYVQGDFNANSGGGGFNDPDVAASVTADAVTLLSVNWNDVNSFAFPYNTGNRTGTTSWFRMGVNAGKGVSFPIPGWETTGLNPSQDWATDGGVHNFLRYLESWNGTLNYEGSLISMFYNRQATGLYKCCNVVYTPPTRAYVFDVNFLTPALLPPRSPMFRDINTTSFTQLLLPSQ